MKNTFLLPPLLLVTFFTWVQALEIPFAGVWEAANMHRFLEVSPNVRVSTYTHPSNNNFGSEAALFDQTIADFVLVNASSDNDLFVLNDGAVISLASLPSTKLSIRANTAPASVGSVKLELTGPQVRTYIDNAAPYSLFGDDGAGNYYFGFWTPPTVGTYTLKATPYTLSSGKGTAGTPTTITFTFVENAPPQDQTPPQVSSVVRHSPLEAQTSSTSLSYRVTFSEVVTGVDAPDFSLALGGTASGTIQGVTTVNTSTYDVQVAQVSGTGTVRLDVNSSGTGIADGSGNALNGGFTSGESYSVAPPSQTQYSLSVTTNGNGTVTKNPDQTTYAEGSSVSLTAVPASGNEFTGWSGDATGTTNPLSVTFNSNKSITANFSAVATAPSITGFVLVDAATDHDIQSIADGDRINLATLPGTQLSIRANTTATTSCSLKFELTGPQNWTATDNATPFALFGDNGNGDYTVGLWNPPTTGAYTLKVTPYPLSNNGGTAGTPSTISFTIVQEQQPPADQTPPTVLSVNRQNPTTQSTSATAVTFRVTFSEAVTGVDATDFSLFVDGTASGTIQSVTAVSTSTYDVQVAQVSGTGNMRLDVKSSNTGIADGSGNALNGGFSTGETYSVAPPSPTQYSLSITTTGSGTVTKSPDQAAYNEGSTVSLTAVPASGYEFSSWSGDATGTANPLTITMNGNKNVSATFSTTTSSQSVTGIILVNASADNDIKPIANGDYISLATLPSTKLSIKANTSPTTVGSVKFELTGPLNRAYTDNGTPYTLFGDDGVSNYYFGTWNPPTVGTYTLKVTPYSKTNGGGTVGTPVTITFTFVENEVPQNDQVPPTVVSINRQSPTTQNVAATSVTFRTTFSESVTGVDATDFALRGTANGTITSVSGSSSVYDVFVSSITGTGSLGLDLKASGTGIADLSNNAIQGGFTSGQTYNIQTAQTTEGFKTITRLGDITITANSTGEKPQSKVWKYDGRHWAVLANGNGTYLWRLDGTSWTNVLKLSSRTTSKADCKVVGGVTHIFLYQGQASQFVSVEYDAANTTYNFWKKRTSTVGLSLDNGIETATIDMDGTGRMWLANAGTTSVYVRYSDAPYSNWSSPITVATGISDDDICAVVALPGKIGVFWSNQVSKRFGFKTHNDGDSPSDWSANEVPASQSALNVGAGMADDHMNLSVAADGTLYCAVKTSYDNTSYPEIALLVRRPNETWDNLYSVATLGTRPIVVLNEVIGKIRVVYTANDNGGSVYYKESSISNISFGAQHTLMSGSAFNNPTSTKNSFNPDVVVMASASTKCGSVWATDDNSLLTAIASRTTQPDIRNQLTENSAVKVYPTVVNRGNRVEIQSGGSDLAEVMVVDSYGQVIKTTRFVSHSFINTTNLPNGTYYINVKVGSRLSSHKFIVVN